MSHTVKQIFFTLPLLFSSLCGAEFFVDPVNGAKDNPGTPEKPFLSIGQAVPSPGDTVFLKPGNYGAVHFVHSGAPGRPIRYVGTGVPPVFDGAKKSCAALVKGNHLILENLAFRNGKHAVVQAHQVRDVTFCKVKISEGNIGLWPYLSSDITINDSDFEALQDGIYVDRCKNTVITKNRIGKNFSGARDGICLYAQCNTTVGSGSVKNARIIAPGRAILENDGVSAGRGQKSAGFHELRRGTLTGGPGRPSALLLFSGLSERKWGPHHTGTTPVPGGTYSFEDKRPWFRLVNHPEWGNKPYSPDGKFLMFDPGKATQKDLDQAKFGLFSVLFPEEYRTVDTRIEGNLIDGCGRQGIRTQRALFTLIRNNKITNCGASGIQLETESFHTWVADNVSRNHNWKFRNETGMWIHENADAVIQNNRISGCQKGLALTQSYDCIIRFNTVENNRAQHVGESDQKFARVNVNAFYITGGSFYKCGMTPGCSGNAVVYNTFIGNGVPEAHYGVFGFGFQNSPPIGKNIFADNTISGKNAPLLLTFHEENDMRFSGNRWTPEGSASVRLRDGKILPLEEWKKTEAAFPAPLAKTLDAGRGKVLKVDHPEPFSAGFAFSDGKKIIPGDDILVGSAPGRVTARDVAAGTLTLDREIQWSKGAPVNYQFKEKNHASR